VRFERLPLGIFIRLKFFSKRFLIAQEAVKKLSKSNTIERLYGPISFNVPGRFYEC